MKLLIFGRDGQVGTALTAILAPLGAIAAYGHAGADFEHPEDVARLVHREQPDFVINAAAHTAVERAETEPELAHRVNAVTPGRLAEAVAEAGSRLIHFSTDYVFDGEKAEPYVEEDATGPLNAYGASKRAGEVAIAASGAEHIILRTSWVHAPSHASFVGRILALAAERAELEVVDDQVGAPTSARLIADIVARIIAQADGGRPLPSGIYHLVAAGETSRNGYARFVIEQALRLGAELRTMPERVRAVASSVHPGLARRPHNSRLSTHKLRSALGYDFPDWRDDLRPTIEALVGEASA